MSTTYYPSPNTANNFDGRIVHSEYAGSGVDAILNPGDSITASDALNSIGGAPIVAKVGLGEAGSLSIVKIDMDDPNFSDRWQGQIPVEAYEWTHGAHSLMAVWEVEGRTLYSDIMAAAGRDHSGRDEISGGTSGTSFYAWGDNPMRKDQPRNPIKLPDVVPENFLGVKRNRDGSVTLSALEDAKNLKVQVRTTRDLQEVIGEKWADEISAESERKPISKRIAKATGNLASKLARR